MAGGKLEAKSKKDGKLPSYLDDCDRPACDDMVAMLKAASGRVAKGEATSASVEIKETVDYSQTTPRSPCPPKSAELGRSSWTLLHSMAAWYPDNPSPSEQTLVSQFFSALARFYPCSYCAADFQENLAKSPVPTESREQLCVWLCEQHNLVNEKLYKPLFRCDMQTLDDRWRKSQRDECG